MKETKMKTNDLIEYLTELHSDGYLYHVTSDYYKSKIIEKGLKKDFIIKQRHIESLEKLLNNYRFRDLNIILSLPYPYVGNKKIMDMIKETFQNINAKDYTISASFKVDEVFKYLKEDTKGGQYLKYIKQLIKSIEDRIKSDKGLYEYLDGEVHEIIDFLTKINNSGFLLCVINKEGLTNLGNDENRFQTEDDISIDKIIEIIEINN